MSCVVHDAKTNEQLFVYLMCSHCSVTLTWFGAEGFPQRPSQGLLWYCCYGSPCKYENTRLVRQLVNMFLILCLCLEWRQSMHVSMRQVICPHVAPAIAQLKSIFGYMRCKYTHIRCICDTYARCGTSAKAEGKHGLCMCVRVRVYVQESGCVGV